MDEPMESSFDPGIIDGLQNYESAVTTAGNVASFPMPAQPAQRQQPVVSSVSGDSDNCVSSTTSMAISESSKDNSGTKPHTYFTPLLRPGSMGTVTQESLSLYLWPETHTVNELNVASCTQLIVFVMISEPELIKIILHDSSDPKNKLVWSIMMTLTEEDYEIHYWPKLKTAIDQLLNMKLGAYISISYEQMYSCVYKCVCKQFSERLYNDLLNHLSCHMDYLNSELKIHEDKTILYIETFSFLMHQYLQALSGIVPIFNYMNRFYVENKLKKDLNEELRKLFRLKVVDIHVNTLIKLLDEASSIPFAISPPTMASIMKNLYALNEEYSKLNPLLFSRYLPSILPPTDPALLEQYAQEAHFLQKHFANTNDFQSHDTTRKRVFEDDISVS